MTTTASYGAWRSPILATDLAASGHPVLGGTWVDDDIWWLERLPSEAGRASVRNSAGTVLPAPWNVRTRVHEYGGGDWAVTPDRALVFVEFIDQRLYRLDFGSTIPLPLTPADAGMRFADIQVRGDEVIAVREWHADGDLTRDIVAVKIDGSGIRSIASGSRFLAFPRFSPDGTKLAWISWEHPQMPWDGTELRVTDLSTGDTSTLMGNTSESVLQPEWINDETLLVTTDRTGWWNIVQVGLDGVVTPIHSDSADFGAPLWQLGARYFDRLDDGRILAVRSFGDDQLVIVTDGFATRINIHLTSISLGARSGNRVLLLGGSATLAGGLRVLDLETGFLEDVRLDIDVMPDVDYLSIAQKRTFSGDNREVHAFAYPPRNDDFTAPPGELPPYIVMVHGGPTGRARGAFSLTYAYFTSRGIGVIDVNYGGSSGYGREYRNRLKWNWGIVDVEDVITAATGLADAGLADSARLAIEGGSAGGFTVLAALTSSNVFAAGVSYYGVADLKLLADDTHDFESRYLDGLIGPLPAASALYAERSPLSRIDRLATPVLLLQGLDDPVVPPAQAELFRDSLAAKGLRHALLLYEGESHGFRKSETIVHSTEAELSFYGQVLGFEPVDITPLLLS